MQSPQSPRAFTPSSPALCSEACRRSGRRTRPEDCATNPWQQTMSMLERRGWLRCLRIARCKMHAGTGTGRARRTIPCCARCSTCHAGVSSIVRRSWMGMGGPPRLRARAGTGREPGRVRCAWPDARAPASGDGRRARSRARPARRRRARSAVVFDKGHDTPAPHTATPTRRADAHGHAHRTSRRPALLHVAGSRRRHSPHTRRARHRTAASASGLASRRGRDGYLPLRSDVESGAEPESNEYSELRFFCFFIIIRAQPISRDRA